MKPMYCLIMWCMSVFASVASAAMGSFHGAEPWFWKDQCLAYVHIQSIHTVNGMERLRLKPIARVAGTLDLGSETVMEAEAQIGWVGSIPSVPKSDSYAMAVITKMPDRYLVSSDVMAFMPEGAGLVPVVGDPTPLMEKILKVMKAIQDEAAVGNPWHKLKVIHKIFEESNSKNPQ